MSETQLTVPKDILEILIGRCMTDRSEYDGLAELCAKAGGRLAGTKAHADAEKWTRGRMKSIGLSPVRLQSFETPTWERGACKVTIVRPDLGEIPAQAHGFAPSGARVEAPLVDLGPGLRDDFDARRKALKGKLAFIGEKPPAGTKAPHRSEQFQWAVDAGAAGMMLASKVPGLLPQTGMCAQEEAPIPSVGLTLEDGAKLKRLIDSGKRITARISLKNDVGASKVANVLGDLKGREKPEEIVVIGGHLDAWDLAEGAVDNGTGCAVVLGVARALAGLPQPPRRTVRFALWAAEEIGIVGSRKYVEKSWRKMDCHVAYLNFDMPGDPDRLLLCGRQTEVGALDEMRRSLEALGVTQPVSTGICLATDLKPFVFAGIPVLSVLGSLVGGAGSCYHTAADTFDKVHLPSLLRTTACAAALTYALADCEDLPFERHTGEQVRKAFEEEGVADAIEGADCRMVE
jgi:hypothetical protein